MNISGAVLVAEVIKAVFPETLKMRDQVTRFTNKTQLAWLHYVALIVNLLGGRTSAVKKSPLTGYPIATLPCGWVTGFGLLQPKV